MRPVGSWDSRGEWGWDDLIWQNESGRRSKNREKREIVCVVYRRGKGWERAMGNGNGGRSFLGGGGYWGGDQSGT